MKKIETKLYAEAKSKEKGVDYKGHHYKVNPWAVCNKSTGGKGEAGEDKFERCVKHVKDKSEASKESSCKCSKCGCQLKEGEVGTCNACGMAPPVRR